jgi:U4/U6 small nuclear ribonucleoprotein PRP3
VAGKVRGEPPDVEWWDVAFLPPARARAYAARAAEEAAAGLAGAPAAARRRPTPATEPAAAGGGEAGGAGGDAPPTFSAAELSLRHSKTAGYVQHPPPLPPPAGGSSDPPAPVALPLMLTKHERQRLRRQRRAERLKEVQDQVRLGLLPPPEPKVRLANLMRVLKDSAVADPSAVERRVREQVAARQRTHEMRNLARKLTPAERRERRWRKMTAHGPGGPEVALFRVSSLEHRRLRVKVDVAATETGLVGVVMQCRAPAPAAAGGAGPDSAAPPPPALGSGTTLVLVEGGGRAVRKYVRLMTQKLDWRRGGGARAAAVAGAAPATTATRRTTTTPTLTTTTTTVAVRAAGWRAA